MRPAPLRVGLTLGLVLALAIFFVRLAISPREKLESVEPIGNASTAETRESQVRGVEWLIAQQESDGGWRSKTYGAMSGGAGNSALVVYALSGMPQEIHPRRAESIRRGLTFLTSNLHPEGFVRAPDDSSDYPTYATALTLIAIRRFQPDAWPAEQRRMKEYLRRSQIRRQTSEAADNPHQGGWDHTGGITSQDAPHQTDVGIAAFVLQTLHEQGGLDAAVSKPALAFLLRCQNFEEGRQGDGGFYFSPVREEERNKAGWNDRPGSVPTPRSYGTATVDGLLGLQLCGLSPDHPRVVAAVAWLTRHSDLSNVPGLSQSVDGADWGKGLRFYYFARMAEVASALPGPAATTLRRDLVKELLRFQSADGSWRNEVNTMREDDPLVATALALEALSAVDHRDGSSRSSP
jgi:squalene-hopene/tetraprenyl-beta-curcumene cyclase